MPYVRTIPVDAAEGLLREQYDRELAEDGYVANMAQQFSLRPEVYAAWGQLRDTEIFDIALAAALRCFFSKVLDSMGAEPDEIYAEGATLLELVELPEPAAAASSAANGWAPH